MKELSDIEQQEEIRLRGHIEFYFSCYDTRNPIKKIEDRIQHFAIQYHELTGEYYKR